MFGLNMFALLVFCAILLLSGHLSGARASRRIGGALLLFNLIRYALPPITGKGLVIPAEFSTVSYFVVPLCILLGSRRIQVWAAYAGLLAGVCYYATMAAAGGPIYDAYPHWDIYLSMCCHGALFLLGASALRRQRFRREETWKLALGVAAIALHALLVRPYADNGTRLFIYELLDGAYAKALAPRSLWFAALPLYYAAVTGILYLTARIFFRLNRALYLREQLKPARRAIRKGITPLGKAMPDC